MTIQYLYTLECVWTAYKWKLKMCHQYTDLISILSIIKKTCVFEPRELEWKQIIEDFTGFGESLLHWN